MNDVLKFDGAAARDLERMYLTPDIVAQRCAVLAAMTPMSGETVLDIGVGPGLLVRDIALAVGETGTVVGCDISEQMCAMARSRCADLGWVEIQLGEATALDAADNSFDCVVVTQVLEYVDDVAKALAEIERVLKPGGRAVIIDTDFDTWAMHTGYPERMARIRAAWDEHFVHRSLPRTLSPMLRAAGFTVTRRETIPLYNPDYHENCFSHGMIGLIAKFVVGRQGISEEEAQAWAAEFETLGREGRYFYSINRYLFIAHTHSNRESE